VSDDHDTLIGLGGRLLVDCRSIKAYALRDQPRAYVLAAHDRMKLDDLREAMHVVYDDAGDAGPRRLLYWETSTCKGFDRDVLDFYKEDRFKDAPQPEEVAVVTSNRLINMVVSATGIGYRLFTSRNLRTYDDIAQAVSGQGG
jgi:hypothetical protein